MIKCPHFTHLRLVVSLFLTLFLGTNISFAQDPEPCGMGGALDVLIHHDPSIQDEIDHYNESWLNLMGDCNDPCSCTEVFRLPIVFHVIHNNGAENISDNQIIDALNDLNQYFAGINGGNDTQIQFYLPSIDPFGSCTSGINRVQTSNPDAQYLDYNSTADLMNLSRWDPNRYINIWIVRCILPDPNCNDFQGTAGYTYPSGVPSSPLDGIIIGNKFLGKTGTANGNPAPATLTHEMGHYLTLSHVWGNDDPPYCTNNCHIVSESLQKGDYICDTDPCCKVLNDFNCNPVYNQCGICNCSNNDASWIYPKDNFMSYAFTCQNKFTPCQICRMKHNLTTNRSELWSESNLTCTGAGGNYGQNVIIDQNTTWTTSNLPNNGNITINGTLTIQPNSMNPDVPVSLTINSGVIVHFCKDGKLVIKPNAILNLHGTLTNSCSGQWKGVEVYGDSHHSQYIENGKRAQGRLVGSSTGLIENAKVAVQLWGPDQFEYTGGQISCTGTMFKNNQIGVDFAQYNNFWPFQFPAGWQKQPRDYFGTFDGCTFVTDDNYSGDLKFRTFLNLDRVKGVKVIGCSFTNNQTISSHDLVDWGYGILASDAGFSVKAACNSQSYPCSGFTFTQFNKLGYGIYTQKLTGNAPFLITQANFNNCFVGLRNSGVSEGTILFNNFNLGNVPSSTVVPITLLSYPGQNANEQDQVGLFFENGISGFEFQENDFNKVSGNVINTIGSICNDIRACLKIYGCTSFQYAESNFVTRPYAPKSVGC